MVALGLGWSVLPPAVAEAETGGPALRRGALLAEHALHAARRCDSRPDPRVEAFLALARGRVVA